MKNFLKFVPLTLTLAFGAAALAQTSTPTPTSAPTPAPAAAPVAESLPRPSRAELIKQFDKNADGILDETERATAREALGTRDPKRPEGQPDLSSAEVPEWIRRMDKNGDGKLDDAERAAGRAELAKSRPPQALNGATNARPKVDRQAVIKEFDKDGDGKLNDQEREAAMKSMRDRLQRSPGQDQQSRTSRVEVIKRFDTNGDGVVDDQERTAAQEAVRQRNANGRYPGEAAPAQPEKPVAPPTTTEEKD